MKKVLTVLVSVCLIAASCLSAFAAPSSDEYTVYDEAMDVISSIDYMGAATDEEILEAADELYNDAHIDEDVYAEIYRIVESGLLHADEETSSSVSSEEEELFNEISAILNDDSLEITEKVAKVAELLKDLPAEQVETVLNELNAAGIIDDEMYSMISDAINGNNSILGGIDTEDGTPISGISDFISNILGMLGIGGGSDTPSDDPSKPANDKTATDATTNPDSGKFEGAGAQTGDYAVVSVAGVALAAGIALVLTKVKKDKED